MTKRMKTGVVAAAAVLAIVICAVLIIQQTHEDVLSKEAVIKK